MPVKEATFRQARVQVDSFRQVEESVRCGRHRSAAL